MFPSAQVLASDFLERFDNVSIDDKLNNSKPLSTHELWANDFLQKNDSNYTDYKELNEDAYEIFSRYENEWKSAELGLVSSEKYSFNKVSLFFLFEFVL